MNSTQGKLYITIAIVVVINMGILVFGWWFISTKIAARFDSLQDAREQAAIEAEEGLRANTLRAMVAENEEALQALRERFLENSEGAIIDFIESIETITEAEGVQLSITSANQIDNETGYELRMQLSGSFSDVVRAIDRIEGGKTVGEFLEVDFTRQNDGDVRMTGTFTLSQFNL